MTWLAPQLNKRIQIGRGVQTASGSGGLNFSFSSLLTVWAGLMPLSFRECIRGQQVGRLDTHEFTIRRVALSDLGRSFTSAFSTAADSIPDIAPIKADYFIFVQSGSTSRGRLFRNPRMLDNNEEGEYVKVRAEEVEERGTGYAA